MAARLSSDLADRVGSTKFGLWFDRTAQFELSNSTLHVRVPTRFHADWIERHFDGDLRAAANRATGADVEIVFDVEPGAFARHGESAPARTAGSDEGRSEERRSLKRDHRHTPVHRRASQRSPRTAAGGDRYEFARFVVGRSNRIAYQSAKELAEGRAPFNALFVHGDCGLGKTHLLQSVAARMRQRQPGARVRYVTGEQFTNEFIMSVKNGQIEAFRNRVRDLDLLIVDDIHFLSNKTATQNEFLCTFDAIGLLGARVVLASDEHPKQIRQFSQRLVSRLMAGMVVKIETPDADTRREFVTRWAKERGFEMHERAVERLTQECVRSIRELGGMLNRLEALVQCDRDLSVATGRRSIGMVLIDQLLGDARREVRCTVSIERVQNTVAERFGLSRAQMLSTGRHQRLVWARSIATYLARETTALSYPEIARAFGRRTHSSFVEGQQRVAKAIETQKVIEQFDGAKGVYAADLVDQLRAALSRPAPATDG